jgi:hypothetical protein
LDTANAKERTTLKPEVESRVVLQFQLDKAPGVVPAQILWSGFYSGRQMTVLSCGRSGDLRCRRFQTASTSTATVMATSSQSQLPTRWATVVASAYAGADLRFFFGGQTLSYYNQAAGLTNTADGYSVDYNPAVFGTNAAGHAVGCAATAGAWLRRIPSSWIPTLALVQR